jgi:hypothetical protein
VSTGATVAELHRFGDLLDARAGEFGEVGERPRHAQGADTASCGQRADLHRSVQGCAYISGQSELGHGERARHNTVELAFEQFQIIVAEPIG